MNFAVILQLIAVWASAGKEGRGEGQRRLG